jgi:PAS domain S-box-containing protein
MISLPTFIHDTRRIVEVNEAGAELFRCDPVALVDQDMMDLIASDEMRGLARLRLRVMREQGHAPEIRYPFLRCDGSTFWASLSSRRLDVDGLFETVLIYEGEE